MVQLSGRQKGEAAVEPPTTVKRENLEDNGEEGARGRCAIEGERTRDLFGIVGGKGDESDIEWRGDKGDPVFGTRSSRIR